MNKIYEDLLKEADIRITSNRLLVLKTLQEKMHGAFSLLDVESALPYMDSSTIFRALTLFAEKQLLHPIDDGSEMQKYCVCHCMHDDDGDCHHGHHHKHQGHVHLTCIKCHETICLEDVPIPIVPIPEGYDILESEYVIKGICPKCQKASSAPHKQ